MSKNRWLAVLVVTSFLISFAAAHAVNSAEAKDEQSLHTRNSTLPSGASRHAGFQATSQANPSGSAK